MSTRTRAPLASRFRGALEDRRDAHLWELADAVPTDERDELLCLLSVHDLYIGPVSAAPGKARWQHHPVVDSIKTTYEGRLRCRLDVEALEYPETSSAGSSDAVAVLRELAAADRVPVIYEWIADTAGWNDLVEVLALEGGPDDGFDDLVAVCQVGLDGRAKMEMARNYWDELGNGDPTGVHRELYRRFARAVGLPTIPRSEQPVAGLRRAALDGALATNRVLQPELIGSLGLTEMQAGPRCRQVVAGLERLGAPPDALGFYAEHARTDPGHGKAWLDEVVAPLSADREISGVVRGARWRWLVNRGLFDALADSFVGADRREPVAG